jgi:hypothetical protein
MKALYLAFATLAATACGYRTTNNSSVSNAKSKIIVCGEKAKGSTVIKFDRDKMTATLSTIDGGFYNSRKCEQVRVSIKQSYICNFFSSTDSGDTVSIAPGDGAELFGTITSWTMTGDSDPVKLGKCKI